MNEDSQNKQQNDVSLDQDLDQSAEGSVGQGGGDQSAVGSSSDLSKQNDEDTAGDSAVTEVAAESGEGSEVSASEPSSSPDSDADGLQAETEPVAPGPELKWYVVHVYSGFEFKVKQALEERVRMNNFTEMFGEIRIPQEKVVELVRGKKKTSNRKFFPGYILVQVALNQDTWHLVNETPKVTGFVGDFVDPAPLSDDEVLRIMDQVEEGASSPRSRMSFEQGETIKVVDGPFADFNGTVEEVRPEKGKVKVLISIFGRATPVELDFVQIEKI